MRRIALSLAATGALAGTAVAGPYTEAGVAAADPSLVAFATGVSGLTRGLQNIADPSLGFASFGAAADALGSPTDTFGVVSLGDGGSITLTFAAGIGDGPGADFAVFENGFGVVGNTTVFGELGFVEVSSNGNDFFRFRSVSLTPTATQVGGFAGIDASNVFNLAGKHAASTGTPFDLASLLGVSPLLNVDAVTHVRIVDVVGSIDPTHARYDGDGRIINDPYSTPFPTGGFDLDAIGVLHVAQAPEPASLAALGVTLVALRRRRAPSRP